MPFEMPTDPRTERRARFTRWVTFLLAALLVVLVVYFAYIGYEGSRQLADSPTDSTDCRTPAAMGWTYEAINYDVETDAGLVDEADPADCSTQGPTAGNEVTGPGAVGLAGWWIPAGSAAPASAPTVVLAHGWSSNKSDMLERAAILHDDYNLLLFDFRNHGRSERAPTTQGVREAGDLRAMIDWLEENKGPESIAVFGVSMGGSSALNAAIRDERVDAVVVESTHATVANAVQARLEASGYPLAMPGAWSTLLGALMRTGVDVSSADPVQAIARLEGRPVLIISGGQDTTIGRDDPQLLLDAATEAGSPATLEICEPAGHAGSFEACGEDYAAWVLGFLGQVMPPA
jgi:pimeloyl-ACP methyl ester carboxylesterase